MTESILSWLLDSDPSIRWQVMRDLTNAPHEVVAVERARVENEGWGAQLLDAQREDGQWGDGVSLPFWWTNMYTMVYLRDLGLDPSCKRAQIALDRVRNSVNWGPYFGNSPFFAGEVEPCINGRVVALAAYFGERTDSLVDRLLGEQLADGGWNCEAERGSSRSSFHTTICVVEGLLAYEMTFGESERIMTARLRAHEYFLERHLLRRLSTGDVINPKWTQFAFPPLWNYDALRALDYLRAARAARDPRMDEAIALVHQRRQSDGRWLGDARHSDTLYDQIGGNVGEPNRWLTLLASRVCNTWPIRSDVALAALRGAHVSDKEKR